MSTARTRPILVHWALTAVLAWSWLHSACAHTTDVPPASERQAAVIRRPEPLPPVASDPQALLNEAGVRKLQQALRKRGYQVPLTGRYQVETRKAVLEFQRKHDLAPTSMPDLETLRQLGLAAKELYRNL